MTANTWFKVKGSKVKVTAYVTANTDSLQIRLVSLLIYRVSASMRMRIAYSRRICSTWPLPGALRKTSETIFSNQTSPKKSQNICRFNVDLNAVCVMYTSLGPCKIGKKLCKYKTIFLLLCVLVAINDKCCRLLGLSMKHDAITLLLHDILYRVK